MAQIRKMDCQVVANISADKFYHAYRTKAQLIPEMSNGLITDAQLLEGDWNSVGAVRLWTYSSQGKTYMAKEVFEEADDKNKTMVFKVVKGDLLNYYSSWRNILQITSMGEGCCVKWTMEFEKQNDDIPDPVEMVDAMIALINNICAYLSNA